MQIEDYSRRIATAKHDLAELSRIADELQVLSGPDAARLRLRAIKLRMDLKRGASGPSTPSTAAPIQAIPRWLSDMGLLAVDGRPLYRYRLSDAAFPQLQAMLKARAADIVARPSPVLAAQFVLWSAEWFRRHYDGTGQRWDALARPLGLAGQWDQYRALADQGLAHWRIPPLRINGTHHRLAAIARQGGFPLAAIEGGGAGWAPGFLERLVGLLLDQPGTSLDSAERIAGSLMGDVPVKWRNPEIRIVSAELAAEVVRLRRLAEAEGAPHGSLISAWLDRHHAGWRERLPVGVTSEAGRALVDGLMKAAAPRGHAGMVGARRLLRIGAEGRRELVELRLAGIVAGADGHAVGCALAGEWSLLRVVPSGEFARYVSGELATAEPDERGVWVARPTTSRVLFDLPPSVSVTVELRGDGQRLADPFVVPGGEAVAGNLRVHVAEGEGDGQGPQQFSQVGTGSGAYRASLLHVDIPAAWDCVPHGPGARCGPVLLGSGGGRAIWPVEGAAVVTTRRGDAYLVRAGQAEGHRDRLALDGTRLHGRPHAGDAAAVFLGAPTVRLSEAGSSRAPAPNEAWWRPCGTAEWRPNPARAEPGSCEFAWRDRQTRHIRDRMDAIILPTGFQLTRRRAGDWLELGIVGWPGRVDIDAGQELGGNVWRFDLKAGARASAVIRLSGEDGQAACLAVPLPHHAWIHDWAAGPVLPGDAISISRINNYVARADGRCQLFAQLHDRNRRRVPQGTASWWVEGELPLSAIRDDLAALLRPLADLNATVELRFNDGHSNAWHVSEFDHDIKPAGQAWQPDRAVAEAGVRIAGRALHNPAQEHDFGEYAPSADAGIPTFGLPVLEGTWLVYLRSNERVLSRPHVVGGGGLALAPDGGLKQAMLIADGKERKAALLAVLDAVLAAPALPANRDTIRAIIDIALSLDGLPPSTFDVLTVISDRPLLGATMLFFAALPEIEPLMRLFEGIPTAWTLVPEACWEQAASTLFEYLNGELPDDLLMIAPIIGSRRRTIAALEPALAPLLSQAAKPEPLHVAANAFLNRSSDRLQDRANPFRPHHDRHLPAWQFDEQFWRALDAPVAAARCVKGRLTLSAAEVTCIKDISRRHPRWFKDAFVAVLKE